MRRIFRVHLCISRVRRCHPLRLPYLLQGCAADESGLFQEGSAVPTIPAGASVGFKDMHRQR
jgi:hypothetical protein